MKNNTSPLKKKRFFKPLVATTLALSFANFALAQCTNSSNSAPVFCYGDMENPMMMFTPSSPSSDVMTWNLEQGGELNAYYMPVVNTNEPVDFLTITFNNPPSSTTDPKGEKGNHSYTITTGKKFFTIKGQGFESVSKKEGGKGIRLGNTGDGNLKINFNGNQEENFTLDLGNTSISSESFRGNILIADDPKQSNTQATNHKSTFIFKEGMKGRYITFLKRA